MINRIKYVGEFENYKDLLISVEISLQLHTYLELNDLMNDTAEIYAPFDINIRKLNDKVIAEADNIIEDSNILHPIKNLQDLFRRCYIKYYEKIIGKALPIIVNNLLYRHIRVNNLLDKFENINLVDFGRDFINNNGVTFTYDKLIEEFNKKNC